MTKKYIFYIDFDGTLAKTFDPSPDGWNVTRAYEASIKDICGDLGYSIYQQDLGGLKNRAPSEIIHLLLEKARESNVRDILRKSARVFYETQKERLEELMPKGLGAPLDYNPDEDIPKNIIAELLVRQKLSYLLPEVGRRFPDGRVWPEPFPGVIEFLNNISIMYHDKISLIILSSGHDEFIRRTLTAWEVPDENVHILSEDTVRGFPLPEKMWLRVKPGPLPMVLAYGDELVRQERDEAAWRSQGLLNDVQHLITAPLIDDGCSLIIGDDLIKDGRQVLVAGRFVWFNPSGKDQNDPVVTGFSFSDWHNITAILTSQEGQLGISEGKPINNILTNRLSRVNEGITLAGVRRESSRA